MTAGRDKVPAAVAAPRADRQRRRVAVAIEASNAYGRGLLAGIHEFVRDHDDWSVFMPEHGRGAPPLEALARWQGDGIIVRIETPEIAAVVRGLGVPVVDVSAARLLPEVPYVETDDAAIVALAVRHLADRDFRQFAYCGDPRFQWSDNRRDHFLAAVAGLGRPTAVFEPRGRPAAATDRAAADDEEQLGDWLESLPKPVGLFASYDLRGRQVLAACRRRSIVVPEEVAVLGVDDDDLLCGLCSPTLSSVVPDALGAGRQAAELLEALMRGERPERLEWLFPPLGVRQRESTDVRIVDDPLVTAALRYIRLHACRGIKVGDVVAALGASRRGLEHRFLKALGHSPHEEIARVQFRRVERLLDETDLPLAEVAARCGFSHAEYMTVAFRRRHGLPPSAWRRRRPPARTPV